MRAILYFVEGPYREPKPLAELIAPDRRRQKTAVLVVASMIAGVLLFQTGRFILEDRRDDPVPPPPAQTVTPSPPTSTPPVPTPGPLTSEEVQGVVAAHRVSLKQACWEKRTHKADSAQVTLNLIVGANGDVVSASASGSDALVAMCVEGQARTWQFPAHGQRSAPIQIPFFFSRE